MSFTRARSKLIIIGSRKTLRNAPVLAEFFELVESKGWILPLGPGAELLHQPRATPVIQRVAKPVITGGAKRVRADDVGKENVPVSPLQRKTKKTKLDHGVLRSRAMLRDVVNDVS